MEKLISIVLPIYNVEKYIEKCMDSVLNQTYKNIEVILVDDGSPDRCPKICEEYAKKDNRIKVVHKENGGLSDARNAGIKVANGEYITFIDSDDYVDEDYVEFLYNNIEKTNADIAIGAHRVLYDSGKVIEKATHENSVLKPKEVLERILYDDGIDLSAWGKLYKISLFDDIKFPKGRIFEDSATTYMLVDKAKKIAVNSESKYNYIIRKDSISNASFSPKKMDLITSTREMSEYIKNKYPDLEKAANRRLMYAYLSTLSQLAKCKEKYPKEEKEMTTYIKKHGNEILKDKRVPKRDKFGIISLKLGFNFYKFIWRLYLKFTKRF